jgi:hypothetical protein
MKWQKIFSAFFFVALGGGLYFYRLWMPDIEWLRVKEVVYEVEPPLTADELRKSLPKLEGQNTLTLRGDELMGKLLSNPWVKAASVKKELPNKIVITAQSKKPVATLRDFKRLVYLDEEGREIDRWSPARGVDVDLPVIAFEKNDLGTLWSPKVLVDIVVRLQKAIAPKHRLSEVVASSPPYFKVYLVTPPIEMLFSQLTWESQIPVFTDLLSRPPRQISQAHKINLVFPKKAVVSFPHSN